MKRTNGCSPVRPEMSTWRDVRAFLWEVPECPVRFPRSHSCRFLLGIEFLGWGTEKCWKRVDSLMATCCFETNSQSVRDQLWKRVRRRLRCNIIKTDKSTYCIQVTFTSDISIHTYTDTQRVPKYVDTCGETVLKLITKRNECMRSAVIQSK